MRIAIILLNQGRGSGEVARQHARELLRHGHDVAFIHAANTGNVEGVRNVDVLIGDAPLPTHEYLPAGGTDQQAVSAMDAATAESYLPAYTAALDSLGPLDLVYAHHANLTAIAAHDYATRTETPYVLFLHGTGIEPRHTGGYADEVWDRIEASILGAAGLLVTTHYVRDELIRSLVPVPEDRFLVLPVGIDLVEFDPSHVGKIRDTYDLPEQYVISPGALTMLKGPQNVVAATELYADLAPTIFTGDGPLRRDLEAALGERGRFLGFVPAADKAELINAATVLTAAPEKREHFGIIYVEAMGGGTVPVAYRGGGVDSIITDGAGILTERDPQALGAAIAMTLGDPVGAASMAAAGRRRAVEHYDKDRLGDVLNAWLEEIVT